MIKIALAALIALSGIAEAKVFEIEVVIGDIIDGDSVKATVPSWPEPLRDIVIRVDGVDTPEKGARAKCAREALAGEKATAFAKRFLIPGMKAKVALDTSRKDKFGRVLSDIKLADGRMYSRLLIDAGHARAYNGGAKQSWCGVK